MTPGFLTGQMAGRAFVHVLRGGGPGPSSIASVGRDGIVAHADADEAIAYCESRGYESAVLWQSWGDTTERSYNLYVLARHGEKLKKVACIECAVSLAPAIAAKVAYLDAREELLAPFLAGFAEGSIADPSGPAVGGAPLTFTPREDVHRLGLAVGAALADELARLVDGALVPCNEVGILFSPGAERATVRRSDDDLGDRWRRCATRQGATIRRGAGGILVIESPQYWGSSVRFLFALEVAVKRGRLRTSTIARVFDGPGSPEDARFLEALHEGMARHARGPELLAGVGALGAYRRRDSLWKERSFEPVRRVWRGIAGLLRRRSGERAEKVQALGIERDPSKIYRLFGGDVCAMPNEGNANVLVVSEDRADYELVRATGITPEPGYVYYLDPDGDLSRRRW